MKLSKTQSDFLKQVSAQATPPAPAPAAPEEPKTEGLRDSKQIAEAIANSARGLGLKADVQEGFSAGDAKSYTVTCLGERANIEIIFDVPTYGDMVGRVKSGLERGEGVRKVMRQIVANAVKEGGIAALPGQATFDPLLAMNPNHYKEALAQQQQQQVQQPPMGTQTPEVR